MHHILMFIQMPFCADTDTSSLCVAADAGVDTSAFAGAVIGFSALCFMLILFLTEAVTDAYCMLIHVLMVMLLA